MLVIGSDQNSLSPSTELYDPATDTWSAAGSMAIGRVGQTATLLQDGRVLAVGDWNNGSPRASAELYVPEPASGASGTKLPATGTGPGVAHAGVGDLLLSVALLISGGTLLAACLGGAARQQRRRRA